MGLIVGLMCLGCGPQDKSSELTDEVTSDTWLALAIDGEAIGWEHRVVTKTEEHYRTEVATEMRMALGDNAIVIRALNTHVEEHGGTPVRSTEVSEVLAQTVTIELAFTGSEIVKTEETSEGTDITKHPYPDVACLMPEARERYVLEQIKVGAKQIEFQTVFLGSDLEPRRVEMTYLGQSTFSLDGQVTLVTAWHAVYDGTISSLEYRTTDGDVVYRETQRGLGMIEATSVTRDVALSAAMDSGLAEALHLYLSVPDQLIENPYETTRVTLRLNVQGGRDVPDLPEAGGQSIVQRDNTSITVVFDPRNPLSATNEELGDSSFLEASPLLDFNDSEVLELIRVTKSDGSLTSRDVADALRAFVYGFITDKSIDLLADSASLTARTRRGDCSEHAVLLAALLRGHGIPARVVTGLAYSSDVTNEPGVFVPHAWTQALIDGYWVDLDATLPTKTPHATYLLASHNNIEELETLGTVLQSILWGSIEIEVLGVEY